MGRKSIAGIKLKYVHIIISSNLSLNLLLKVI